MRWALQIVTGARLQQVVWNLLANAVKFSMQGGRVQVKLERRGEMVQIVVTDNGEGISADFLPKIFTAFSRSQGVYVGADLTGTVVAVANDWNKIYYGRPVSASEILVQRTVQNRQAKELLGLLAQASK